MYVAIVKEIKKIGLLQSINVLKFAWKYSGTLRLYHQKYQLISQLQKV